MKIGLSRGHWSEIVQGKHPYVSAKTREKIIDAFSASFDDLFEIEEGDSIPEETSAGVHAAISDQYLVDSEIGQGGMGTVYVARDLRHGRQVAVKVINPEAVTGIGAAQFLKETRLTARLEHENILTLLDSGEAAGHPYFVMPLVRGGSLRDYLDAQGQLSVEESAEVLKGVARALSYAHGERVIHCDIKPENILRTSDGHTYVADFGISRSVHREVLEWRRRGEIISSAGTPAYVSPEQAAGEPDLDARSDVYSLACVVYEMLAGEAPFAGRNTMEVVSRRFTDAIPNIRHLVPSVPVSTARVLERAMEVDRDRRYDSVKEFANDIERSVTERNAAAESLSIAWIRTTGFVRRMFGKVGPGNVRGANRVVLGVARMWNDLAYAVRGLRQRPGFALVAVLTLGLGIGVNAALFALVNSIFFRDTIVAAPETVVEIHRVSNRSGRYFAISHIDANDIIANAADVFSGVTKFRFISGQLGLLDSPGRLIGGELVSHNYFEVLGVPMHMGRGFFREEDQPSGSPSVAVISFRAWVEVFAADSSIFETPVRINGRPYEVVGVAPAEFTGRYPGISADVWLTMAMEDHIQPNSLTNNNIYAVARLHDGVSAAAAENALSLMSQRFDEERGRTRNWDFGAVVAAESILQPGLDEAITAIAALLMAIVIIVLLVTCTNLAGFLLARAAERRKEVAVRLAMGASRGTVVRQMLTESLLLGLIGGAVGVVLAIVMGRIAGAFQPPLPMPIDIDPRVDARVLFFTFVVSVVAGVVFGLIPASHAANPEVASVLRGASGASASRAGARWRRGLVSVQLAMSLLLLITAGLFVRSLWNAARVDLGFVNEPAAIISVNLRGSGYESSRWAVLQRQLVDAASSVPGVASVAVASRMPLALGNNSRIVNLPGQSQQDGRFIEYGSFTPNFFEAFGVRTLAGRVFDEIGSPESPGVILSEAAAQVFFSTADVVGRTIIIGGNQDAPATIVGVVPNIKIKTLNERPEPFLYLPIDLFPAAAIHLIAKGAGSDRVLSEQVREALLGVDPNLYVTQARTLDDHTGIMFYLPRMAVRVTLLFAGLAILLSAIGLFGVVSHNVASRTKEIGIRISLGASNRSVVRLIVMGGVKMVVTGTVIGTILGLVAGKGVERFLLEMEGFDPATLVATVSILGVVGVLAAYIPARRVTKVNPVEALRAE